MRLSSDENCMAALVTIPCCTLAGTVMSDSIQEYDSLMKFKIVTRDLCGRFRKCAFSCEVTSPEEIARIRKVQKKMESGTVFTVSGFLKMSRDMVVVNVTALSLLQ